MSEQATYQPIKKMSFTYLIATVLGLGNIPFAPGTIGSLVAVLDFSFFIFFFHIPNPIWPIIFPISWIATYYYCQHTKKHDPKEVIIDEYVGQYLSACLTYYFIIIFMPESLNVDLKIIILMIFLNFALFRFFDITKLSLVGYFDRQDTALSIIMDDVIAGIFAAVISIIIISFAYFIV